MKLTTYRNWRIAITAIIAAVAAISVAIGNIYVLIAALAAGMIISIILRRKVKGIMYDERNHTAAHKAARLTVGITGVGMAIAGTVLLVLNRGTLTSTPAQIGLALLYTTCALLVINALAYTYYNHKLGGKNE